VSKEEIKFTNLIEKCHSGMSQAGEKVFKVKTEEFLVEL
jgi:hypothetical protein